MNEGEAKVLVSVVSLAGEIPNLGTAFLAMSSMCPT
jgi:hypothetical protein